MRKAFSQMRKSRPVCNRDINQGVLNLWYKFVDPGLNGSQVVVRTTSGLTQKTNIQTQAITIKIL